jgi:hypothetical protein
MKILLFHVFMQQSHPEAVIKKINEITGGSITVNPSDKTMSIDGSKVELIWGDKASKLRITKAANKVCTNAQGAQHLMKLMASGLNPIATSDYESISDVMRNWWYKNESWSLELSPYTGELPMCHVHPISGQIHSSFFLESRAKQYRDAVKLTENWTMDTHGTFNSAWSIFRVKDATEDYVVTELSKLISKDSRTFIRGASTDKFIRQIVRSCQMRTWLEYESEGCVWVKKSSDPSLSSLDKKATLTALMNNASLDAQYILYTGNLPTDSIAANQLYGAISSIGAGCIGMTEYVSKRYAVLKEEWHNTQKFVESWNSNGDWETILIPSFVAPIPIPDDSAKNIFFNYQGDSESALDALNNISERAIASLRSYVEGGDISIIWSTPPVLRIGALKYGQDPQLVLGLLNTLRVKARLEIDASDSGTEADVFKWWALHNDAVNGMYLRTPIKRPQYGHVPALWVLTLDGVTMEAPPAPMNPIPAFSPAIPILQPNNSAVNIFNNYQALNNYLVAIQPSIAQGDIALQNFLKFVRALDSATNGAFTRLTDLTMPVPKISDTGIVIGKLKPGMNAVYARATLNALMTKSQQLTSAFEVINYHEDQHIVEGDMLFPPKDCVVGVDDGSVENMFKGWIAGYVDNVLMRPSGFIPVVPPVVPAVNKLLQVEGYFPLEIINGTKRDDSEVYVFIKAAQESDGRDCVFARVEDEDTTNGLKLRAETVTETMVTDYTSLSNYNYRLDTVTKTSDGRRILLVPPSISGRVYFSVGRPMAMQAAVDAKGMIRIGDPDGFKPRDPNYYTLYDKVEYTFVKGKGSWLNPTCVDFISLPIHVEQPGAVSEIKSAGFAGSRKAVFKSIKDTFAPDAVSPEWSKLVLPFIDADSRRTDLRIMAPGKAMVKDMPGANPFNTRYLNAGIAPFNLKDLNAAESSSEYTEYLWEYYKTNTLAVNAIELKGKFKIRPNPAEETNEDFQFFGSVNENNEFVFTNNTATHEETYAELISKFELPFLVGAQESDDAPKNTLIEVIMRELSSAFAFSHTDFLWRYYETNRIRIDAKEIWSKFRIDGKEPGNVDFEDAYMFTGTVNENNEFVFTSGSGSVVRKIGKPLDSVPFFAGAQGAFDAANNTPEAVIVRELTSAFEVGLLPAPDNTLLNKDYFISKRSSFYKTNGYLPPRATAGKGPWYDLYSQALHKAAGSLPVYTFAYDDALAQDGTLHDSDGQEPHLVQITIGDLTDVEIPNPEKDPNLYKIKFDVPSALTVLQESGEKLTNQLLSGVKMPLALNVNGKPIKLYVNPPMITPPYQHAEGIVVERKEGTTDVTLRFPSEFSK